MDRRSPPTLYPPLGFTRPGMDGMRVTISSMRTPGPGCPCPSYPDPGGTEGVGAQITPESGGLPTQPRWEALEACQEHLKPLRIGSYTPNGLEALSADQTRNGIPRKYVKPCHLIEMHQ